MLFSHSTSDVSIFDLSHVLSFILTTSQHLSKTCLHLHAAMSCSESSGQYNTTHTQQWSKTYFEIGVAMDKACFRNHSILSSIENIFALLLSCLCSWKATNSIEYHLVLQVETFWQNYIQDLLVVTKSVCFLCDLLSSIFPNLFLCLLKSACRVLTQCGLTKKSKLRTKLFKNIIKLQMLAYAFSVILHRSQIQKMLQSSEVNRWQTNCSRSMVKPSSLFLCTVCGLCHRWLFAELCVSVGTAFDRSVQRLR